jgi:cobalt-zinc-cadmium efflux system membrane fusion protein
MKTRNKIILISASLLLFGCHKEKESAQEPEPKAEGEKLILPEKAPQLASVSTETVTARGESVLRLNGRVVWNDDMTVRIFAPFAGRVTQIAANPGQQVKAGTPLATIASPDYGQAQAEARKAATDYSLAERTVSRVRDLFEHGAAARKEVDSAEADFARAASEKSRTTGRMAMYGGAAGEIDQSYRLKTPIDGTVVEKNINTGQEVRPDQMLANVPQLAAPLFTVTDPRQMWVYLDVSEEALPMIREGRPLTVRCRAYPNQVFRGKVELITDGMDPVTRTVKIRGVVDNTERLLKSEMYVSIELPEELKPGIQISACAVFLKGDKHFVFVQDAPGQFALRQVTLGAEREGHVIVLEGLKQGQTVVTAGSLLLEQMQSSLSGT